MESSSNLAKDLAFAIGDLLPYVSIKFYTYAISKNISSLRLDFGDSDLPEAQKQGIRRLYDKAKSENTFSIKKIRAQDRKFFVDWISINKDVIKSIANRDIILIDDYITSGATLDAVCKELIQLAPHSLRVLTLIK
jgi:hypothetical protein